MPQKCLFFVAGLSIIFSGLLCAEELDATLHWANKAPLSTPVSGVVETVHVAAGDFVKKGAVLMALDDRILRACRLAHSAELKRAKNDRDEAERELGRTQELYDRTLISVHDLELAVIQRDAAAAKYQMAQAALVKADIDLWHAQVRAPFDAWVMKRDVAVGQTIVSRLQVTPIFELVETSVMLARAQLTAKQLSTLRKSGKAMVVVDGKTYQGTIHYIALEPSAQALQRYAVDVTFNSGNTLLRAGLPAKVNFQ
ncbi:efflux RND transporter periplasmic adaptor subunit [Beggiatoa alba]|nr:efflux RND transporter periplasmic adaptor subunit [Beggiatoa alba]